MYEPNDPLAQEDNYHTDDEGITYQGADVQDSYSSDVSGDYQSTTDQEGEKEEIKKKKKDKRVDDDVDLSLDDDDFNINL